MLNAWNAFPMLDRLFDDVMSGVGGTALGTGAAGGAFSPAIDVRANEDEIVFACDVPGLKHEDLDVFIEGSTLTIKGQRKYAGDEKEQVWLGRSYGVFEKAFTLPPLVDADNMSADLADGVLTIRVPKKPQAKPRRIAISGGGHETKQLHANDEAKEEENKG